MLRRRISKEIYNSLLYNREKIARTVERQPALVELWETYVPDIEIEWNARLLKRPLGDAVSNEEEA